jgi:hypothetical protein
MANLSRKATVNDDGVQNHSAFSAPARQASRCRECLSMRLAGLFWHRTGNLLPALMPALKIICIFFKKTLKFRLRLPLI